MATHRSGRRTTGGGRRSRSCSRSRWRWRSRRASRPSSRPGRGGLRALARGGGRAGILPRPLAATNSHHTPYWGVVIFLAVSAAVVAGSGAREQQLVLFYAVAVFLAFLCGLLAM